MKDIKLIYKGQIYSVPNRWEQLSSQQFIRLVSDLFLMSAGKLSAGEVRINYLCDMMEWKKSRFRSEEQIANLITISEQITFIFQINYPENNEVLGGLDKDTYNQCRRIDPYRLNIPLARILRKLDYHYVVDLCFCKQLLPEVFIGDIRHSGYTIDTSFGMLTCSLTALQYIEARELIDRGAESLPLMASILYFPSKQYDSEQAHSLAKDFARLPQDVLAAISFNFQAFNNYLFSRTSFSLLSKFIPKPDRPITTDASDALYDLSKEGLGDARQVEQMNVLTYFKVLRKKTIDAVKDMKGFGWDKAKISNEVGLPISIIDKIL